ncbi:Flp family type IVb pilin [Aureimonas sp. AU20]|uniref:Flp family type IVb pilin n=1 Tax=Aureimonas sp. AU20 TaxID=1349819 RepID=UPI0007202D46|nr:Flp family type IVb pilin [Aureimonas sp. AU20]ALN74336.1 hypothetical protein M673_16535 [Aureimonas sp. AU20]
MSALGRNIRRGIGDVRGTTAIEYALLASLIAMAMIGGVSATGQSIGGMMGSVFAQISAVLSSE